MPAKGNIKDLTGLVFNNWTVLGFDHTKGRNRYYWLSRCACGTERPVYGAHLKNGGSRSCGCLRPKGESHSRFKHGMSEAPEFKIWLQIQTRCYNPNTINWEHYGGKGIGMCARWRDDFMAFYKDMGPRPSPKHSIDRVRIHEGYSPSNCRWATPKEQARNTSRTAWVSLNGKRMSLAEACEITGLNYTSAQERRAAGRDWRGSQ